MMPDADRYLRYLVAQALARDAGVFVSNLISDDGLTRGKPIVAATPTLAIALMNALVATG